MNRFIISLLFLMVSCMYKRDYNPTFWEYGTRSTNNSEWRIDHFTIEMPGRESLLANERSLLPNQNRSEWPVNLPIRGKAMARWKCQGVDYSQEIDLGRLGLFSYKNGTLVFEFVSSTELRFYLAPY